MQWDDTGNGGFSTAPSSDLVAQPVEGYFGPKNINAAAAKRDPDSLWNFIATLIQRYRECPELGWGRFELIKQPSAQVLLHRCTWDGSVVIVAHNFGAEPASVSCQRGVAGRTGKPRSQAPCSGTCSAARIFRSRTTADSKSRWIATATGGSGSSDRRERHIPEPRSRQRKSGDPGRRETAAAPKTNPSLTVPKRGGNIGAGHWKGRQEQAPASSPGGPAMLKEAKAHVTRIRALDQLHRGDEIEARLRVGPNYDDVVIRRGSVQETAPGIGVVWIMDRHQRHAQSHQRGRMQPSGGSPEASAARHRLDDKDLLAGRHRKWPRPAVAGSHSR